jgi:hypothetical protein
MRLERAKEHLRGCRCEAVTGRLSNGASHSPKGALIRRGLRDERATVIAGRCRKICWDVPYELYTRYFGSQGLMTVSLPIPMGPTSVRSKRGAEGVSESPAFFSMHACQDDCLRQGLACA